MILLRPVKVMYGDLWEAKCLCGKFSGCYVFLTMLLLIKFNNRNPGTLQHYRQHTVICYHWLIWRLNFCFSFYFTVCRKTQHKDCKFTIWNNSLLVHFFPTKAIHMGKPLYDCIVVFTLKPVQNYLVSGGKTHASKCDPVTTEEQKSWARTICFQMSLILPHVTVSIFLFPTWCVVSAT